MSGKWNNLDTMGDTLKPPTCKLCGERHWIADGHSKLGPASPSVSDQMRSRGVDLGSKFLFEAGCEDPDHPAPEPSPRKTPPRCPSGDGGATGLCQGPGCTRKIVSSGKGRPKRFCSDRCRKKASRA